MEMNNPFLPSTTRRPLTTYQLPKVTEAIALVLPPLTNLSILAWIFTQFTPLSKGIEDKSGICLHSFLGNMLRLHKPLHEVRHLFVC